MRKKDDEETIKQVEEFKRVYGRGACHAANLETRLDRRVILLVFVRR